MGFLNPGTSLKPRFHILKMQNLDFGFGLCCCSEKRKEKSWCLAKLYCIVSKPVRFHTTVLCYCCQWVTVKSVCHPQLRGYRVKEQSSVVLYRCTSGCVVECWISNREVAGSNLSLGYFAPRSTQPFIPQGSVNEYQLWLGRQRQVWLIPTADERVGVQVKLKSLENIPERFWGGDSLRRGAISSVCTFTFYRVKRGLVTALSR